MTERDRHEHDHEHGPPWGGPPWRSGPPWGGGKPPWWPEDESWPPRGPEAWRGMRRHFVRKFVRRPRPVPGLDRRAVGADRRTPVPGPRASRPVHPDRDRPGRSRHLPDRARGPRLRGTRRRRDGGRRPCRRGRLRDARPGARAPRGPAARPCVQRDGRAPRDERGAAPPAPRGRHARAPDAALGDPGEPRSVDRRPVSGRRRAPATGPRGDEGDGAPARRPPDAVDRRGGRAHAAPRADRPTPAHRRRRARVQGARRGGRGSSRTAGRRTLCRSSTWIDSASARC